MLFCHSDNIGTSEEVKRIKEEILSKRTVSLESRDIQELKEMIFKMQKQLDEQSNKINQLEQKLDYLTQRPSADNVKLIAVVLFCFTYILYLFISECYNNREKPDECFYK